MGRAVAPSRSFTHGVLAANAMNVVCVDATDVGAEFILAHSFTMPSLKMQIRTFSGLMLSEALISSAWPVGTALMLHIAL